MLPTTARLAMAALILGVPLRASAGDWSSPVLGGGGGAPFAGRCPPDQHLVGLEARVGDDVDQVGSLCARAKTDGTRDGELTGGGAGGGSGGAPVRIVCPDDAPFVRKLAVDVEGVDSVMVNGILITCGPLVGALPRPVAGYNLLNAGGPTQQVEIGTDLKWKNEAYDCPDGMGPVGVHGRAGAMVDALGIMCGTIVTVAPPPPPAPEPAASERVGGVEQAPPEPPPMVEPKVRRGGITAP